MQAVRMFILADCNLNIRTAMPEMLPFLMFFELQRSIRIENQYKMKGK
jgi:hypothetical protein